MTRAYKPLRDKLVIQVEQGEEKSSGGIILAAEGTREAMAKEEGIVLALGNSCFYDTHEQELKIGDKVAFARYAGKVLGKSSEGKEIRVMVDIDILCIIEDN